MIGSAECSTDTNRTTIPMAENIFLSYAREDESKASELVRLLKVEGWSVWWDREVVPGQDFELEIDVALKNAQAVLVLWSVYSVSSNWVRNEAMEAKEQNKLIPVILDDARIPLSFRSLNTIELKDWPDKKRLNELSVLKTAVRRILASEHSVQPQRDLHKSDELTLSVRVANRVVELVSDEKNVNHTESEYFQLQLERCISHSCSTLLSDDLGSLEKRIDICLMNLAKILNSSIALISQINFSNLSIITISELTGESTTSQLECKVLAWVNEYCRSDTNDNLDFPSTTWQYSELLCLPLPGNSSNREFVWFIAEPEIEYWTEDVQASLLKLSNIMLKISRIV